MCWDHARYVTNTSSPYEEMVREMARKKAIGIETIIIYMHEVISLDDYCRAAAENDITVQCWITPESWIDNPIKRVLPEEKWEEMETRYGIQLKKPCLNHPDNRKSMINNAKKLMDEFGNRIEAIHLDGIRSENAILSFQFPCECEACRALRKRFLGYEVLNKKDLQNPAILYKELDIKNSNVSEIVRVLHKKTHKSHLALTMAARVNYLNQPDIEDSPVWGLGPAILEGQDWVKWHDNGWVDAIYPMNYHLNETYFTDILDSHIRLLQGAVSNLYCGIGVESSMGKNTPEQIVKYIKKIKDRGLPGCVFFNKSDVFEPEYEPVIKQAAEEQ